MDNSRERSEKSKIVSPQQSKLNEQVAWWSVDHVSEDDPLLSCLINLTEHYELPFTTDALCAGLPLVKGQLTPTLFLRAAKRAGLSAKVVRRPLKKISSLVLPVVLLLKNNQACLLTGFDHQRKKWSRSSLVRAQLILPETHDGGTVVDINKLEQQYTGVVIFVKPEFRFDASVPLYLNRRSKHWFWSTVFRSWRIYRDVMVASLLINIFALATPFFVMNVYDRVVPNNAIETLWVIAAGVTVIYLFDVTLRMLRGYFIDLVNKKIDISISALILERVMSLPLAFKPPSVGAFAANLNSFETIRDFITSTSLTAFVDVPFIILFIMVIYWLGGPLAFIPLAGVFLILLYSFILQRPLRESIESTFQAISQKHAILIESLTGLETIKTLGAEGKIQRKWEKTIGYIASKSIKSRMLSTSAVNVSLLMQQLVLVGLVIAGVYRIAEGEMSMGGLIAVIMLSSRCMSPMAQVANLIVQYHQAKTSLNALESTMQMPVERYEDKSYVHRPAFRGDISFNKVSFTYPNAPLTTLQQVSFKINAGEHIALIGRIGSGKTTLAKLILGLYEPTEGSVELDGVESRQIDPANIRRNMGYVSQDITLFSGTLKENIIYGITYASDAAILEAAKLSGVSDFSDQHPHGLDMHVGERGEGLSGGQRQLVGLARAILRNPPILLLDEPTNNMDHTTEAQLITKLGDFIRNKTTIIVTHRTSLLQLVDRIMVIDNGHVIADGPKPEIMLALKEGRLAPW